MRPLHALMTLAMGLICTGAANAYIPPQAAPASLSPDTGAVEEAAQRLAGAKNPVVIVGGGAVGAAAEVTALAEALGAPVITTIRPRNGSHPSSAT